MQVGRYQCELDRKVKWVLQCLFDQLTNESDTKISNAIAKKNSYRVKLQTGPSCGMRAQCKHCVQVGMCITVLTDLL